MKPGQPAPQPLPRDRTGLLVTLGLVTLTLLSATSVFGETLATLWSGPTVVDESPAQTPPPQATPKVKP